MSRGPAVPACPILAAVLLFGLVGCVDQPLGIDQGSPLPSIVVVVVSPDGVTIPVSGSLQMTAVVPVPREWRTKSIEWRTADTTIATVSAGGMVRGRSPGATGVIAQVHSTRNAVAQGTATVMVR